MEKKKKNRLLDIVNQMIPEQQVMMVYLARIALCRRSNWHYCKYTNLHLGEENIYQDGNDYLKMLCNFIQKTFEKRIQNKQSVAANNGETLRPFKIVIVTMPPRFGKSATAQNSLAFMYGRNPKFQTMGITYQQDLSYLFSQNIRDKISQPSGMKDWQVRHVDVFPRSQIETGRGAVEKWCVKGSIGSSFTATSLEGGITGKGCRDMLFIDDQVKDDKEALNDTLMDELWNKFYKTITQRVENNTTIFIIMTPWVKKDFIGRIKASPALSKMTCIYEIAATNEKLDENGMRRSGYEDQKVNMTAPLRLNWETYWLKRAPVEEAYAAGDKDAFGVFMANYHNVPMDSSDLQFNRFETYDKLPFDVKSVPIRAICDTAKGKASGSDHYCLIIYAVYNFKYYILHILYENQAERFTTEIVARLLLTHSVKIAGFEANNGGDKIGEMIELHLKDKLGSTYTEFRYPSTSMNKQTKIINFKNDVMNHVCYPSDFKIRWKVFYEHVAKWRKTTTKDDDAPDTLCLLIIQEFELLKRTGPVNIDLIPRSVGLANFLKRVGG